MAHREEIMEYREFFQHVRGLMQAGEITYEQAKAMTCDKLGEMNEKGLEIAKKHGKKFKPFTFTGVMR